MGDGLSDLGNSDNEENGDDAKDDVKGTELGKRSEDLEPGWIMCRIFTMRVCGMQSYYQNQRQNEEWTQLGWGDAVD
jgi:hypothetical protein